MTTINQAREAIYERFTTQWADETPVVFTNEQADTDGAWVRLTMQNQIRRQKTLGPPGARKFDDRGIIFIQVFEPGDSGTARGDELVALAREIFEGVSFSGVKCFAAPTTEIGPDGKWFRRNVSIGFDYDETK